MNWYYLFIAEGVAKTVFANPSGYFLHSAFILHQQPPKLRAACGAAFCTKPGVSNLRSYYFFYRWHYSEKSASRQNVILFSVQFLMVEDLPLQKVAQRETNKSQFWWLLQEKCEDWPTPPSFLIFSIAQVVQIQRAKTILLKIEGLTVIWSVSWQVDTWGTPGWRISQDHHSTDQEDSPPAQEKEDQKVKFSFPWEFSYPISAVWSPLGSDELFLTAKRFYCLCSSSPHEAL